MSKHTPAPWTAREVRGLGFPGQVGWAIDYNEDQEQVVDYVYEEADARLISAAPELLEALEYVLEYTSEDDIKPEPLAAARAAIAKARGN